MTTGPINDKRGYISSFDIEERLEELRANSVSNDRDQQEELEQIEALVEELGGTEYVLMEQSSFGDYVREAVEHTGDVDGGHWLLQYINWAAMTRDERDVYGLVEFAGVYYNYREA